MPIWPAANSPRAAGAAAAFACAAADERERRTPAARRQQALHRVQRDGEADERLVRRVREGHAVEDVQRRVERAVAGAQVASSPLSQARRLALLPRAQPMPWDELMRDPAYCQALERLPSGA